MHIVMILLTAFVNKKLFLTVVHSFLSSNIVCVNGNNEMINLMQNTSHVVIKLITGYENGCKDLHLGLVCFI